MYIEQLLTDEAVDTIPNILCFTETWLEEMEDNIIKIHDY